MKNPEMLIGEPDRACANRALVRLRLQNAGWVLSKLPVCSDPQFSAVRVALSYSALGKNVVRAQTPLYCHRHVSLMHSQPKSCRFRYVNLDSSYRCTPSPVSVPSQLVSYQLTHLFHHRIVRELIPYSEALKRVPNVEVPFEQFHSCVIVRVHHACFRFVHNVPPRIQNFLGDSQILEYFQLFWKSCCLPHLSPYRCVDVGKMIILVSHARFARRIFHHTFASVQRV